MIYFFFLDTYFCGVIITLTYAKRSNTLFSFIVLFLLSMGALFQKPTVADNSALIAAQKEQEQILAKQQAEKEKLNRATQEKATAELAKRRRNQKGRNLLATTTEPKPNTLG